MPRPHALARAPRSWRSPSPAPRGRGGARSLIRSLVVVALVAAAGPGCGDEPEASEAPTPAPSRTGRTSAATLDGAAIVDAPTPANLLAALAQDHRRARRALGRHRLGVEADFSLEPPPDLPRPTPDAAIPSPQKVHDSLSLTWAGDDDRAPALHLRQGPDAADPTASRELIVLGEEAYARLPYRGWLRRPVDSELHWRWLDDAEHAVHDLVAFAAPSLSVRVAAQDDASITLALELREGVDPALIAAREEGPGAWRRDATLRSIAGEVVIDRAHALWQRAKLRVEYSVVDNEGRTLTGVASLEAERVVDGGLTVEAPAKSAPSPERIRYEDERRRLLDGLGR